jgi:hypothetical protein
MGWKNWTRSPVNGSVAAVLAAATASPLHPPAGQLVDLGGHRLHVHCTGRGAPTVVIEGGFDELSSDVRLANERIQVDAFTVAARDYAIRGKGVVTFAQQVDLIATLVASAPFTVDVIGALKEAKYLADDQGRLSIPFRLTGQMPNVRAKPDSDFVGRVLQKAIVGEGLDQLLGGGKGNDPKDPKPMDGKGLLKKLDKLFGH